MPLSKISSCFYQPLIYCHVFSQSIVGAPFNYICCAGVVTMIEDMDMSEEDVAKL